MTYYLTTLGVYAGVENGYFQGAIADAAYDFERGVKVSKTVYLTSLPEIGRGKGHIASRYPSLTLRMTKGEFLFLLSS